MEEKNFENMDETEQTSEYINNDKVNDTVPPAGFEDHMGGSTGSDEVSGEYRYKPPFAAYGANTPGASSGFAQNDMKTETETFNEVKKEKKVKKVKKKSQFSSAIIAVFLAACILVSFGAGFGGAYLYGEIFGTSEGTVQSSGGSGAAQTVDGGKVVIHQSTSIVDDNGNEITDGLSVTDVATAVADSVVEITTEYTSSYGYYQYVTSGAGSGVIVSADGYIITNNHVIVDDSSDVADLITVRLRNGDEYKAECIGTDSESDIAVLKIEAEDLKFAVAGDSSKLLVGDEVVAVGNPLGELGGTVTDGIISATSREIDVDGTKMTLLQTNAAINPGNSGGGLFNMKGELIGIVNAKSSGTGIEGLGFAIPVNMALDVFSEICEHGYVTGRTYIGVRFVEVKDAFEAYRYFKSKSTGVYVYEASKGYNDDVLKYGDRVIAIDGKEITSYDDIKSIVKGASVGDKLKFSVYREGKLTEAEVECFEYNPETVEFSEDK